MSLRFFKYIFFASLGLSFVPTTVFAGSKPARCLQLLIGDRNAEFNQAFSSTHLPRLRELRTFGFGGERDGLVNSDGVEVLPSVAQFKARSAENLSRMLSILAMKYPLPANMSEGSEAWETAVKLSERLNFKFLKPLAGNLVGRDLVPNLSRRGDLQSYSIYVHGPQVSNPAYLNGKRDLQVVFLNDKFATDFGYALPGFTTVSGLLRFFSFWAPERVDDLFASMRFHLPNEIDSVEKFFEYANPSRLEMLFPAEKLPQVLKTLRLHIIDYCLTVDDMRALYKELFVRYTLSRITSSVDDWDKFIYEWKLPQGPQNLFHMSARAMLNGVDNYVLRVPSEMPENVNHLGILRGVIYRPFADMHSVFGEDWRQSPFDSRRLDHDLMP